MKSFQNDISLFIETRTTIVHRSGELSIGFYLYMFMHIYIYKEFISFNKTTKISKIKERKKCHHCILDILIKLFFSVVQYLC